MSSIAVSFWGVAQTVIVVFAGSPAVDEVHVAAARLRPHVTAIEQHGLKRGNFRRGLIREIEYSGVETVPTLATAMPRRWFVSPGPRR